MNKLVLFGCFAAALLYVWAGITNWKKHPVMAFFFLVVSACILVFLAVLVNL